MVLDLCMEVQPQRRDMSPGFHFGLVSSSISSYENTMSAVMDSSLFKGYARVYVRLPILQATVNLIDTRDIFKMDMGFHMAVSIDWRSFLWVS